MYRIFILHLEDSTLDADLIRARLEKAGLEFDLDHVDGEDGFRAAIGAKAYDLILADYSLPDFDGLSALEIARRASPDCPFIFVSGVLGEEVAIDTLKSGATDYVLKQRLERLAPAVARALGESRERGERRRAEAALRDGRVQHRLILDSIKDYAIVTIDEEGRISHWSAGAEQVFGRPESEMLDRSIDGIYTEEDRDDEVPARERREARRCGRLDAERWYVRGDGARFWGSGVVMPLVNEAGGLHGFTIILRDMTSRKRAQDALVEADRRKDEFLAMLAHELRNPLSSLHNAAEMMRRCELTPERFEWAKEVIAHQLRHLTRLVDDLLDISRIRLRTERINLSSIVNRAVETTRALLEERHHRLIVALAPGPLWVEADPTRMEQVIGNLLTNAAKYTEKGGEIRLDVRRDGDELVVSVRDDGMGLTPEMLARVFDLFIQADHSLDRAQGGLGIGLTVARNLVELHGGRIVARSDGPGKGSEFIITLPSAPARVEEECPPWPASREFGASLDVLVVDDSRHSAWALAELLRGAGHRVRTAHDGLDALEAARREPPDAILLDIGLPTLDGYQVARKLRDEGLSETMIVAITGYGEEQAFRRSREAGFDYHLVKPVDLDALLTLLDQSLPGTGPTGPVAWPAPARDPELA